MNDERFEEIAGEGGFWSDSTRTKFKETEERLLQAGFETEEIFEMLSELYAAVANEFGG